MTTAPFFHVAGDRLRGPTVRLDGPEGRHAAVVRRLQPPERVNLTDGAGLLAECVVVRSDGHALDLEVLELHVMPPPNPRIMVVQALPKGDRGETAVETMTEIGVDAVVPWSAERSITQWRGERGAKALAKWRATAAEASKQARRAWWPAVGELASTAQVARLLAAATVPVVMHEHAEVPLATVAVPLSPNSGRGDGGAAQIVLVIGPEGGIAPDELATFAQVGAVPYRMGPTVLRTSTAGTAAAAVLLAGIGRWN